jgi:hypothetical protein
MRSARVNFGRPAASRRAIRTIAIPLLAALIAIGAVAACSKRTGAGGPVSPQMYVHRGADALLDIAVNFPTALSVTSVMGTVVNNVCTSSDTGTQSAISAINSDLATEGAAATVDCTKKLYFVKVLSPNSTVDQYYAMSLVGTTNTAETGSAEYFPATTTDTAQVMFFFPSE